MSKNVKIILIVAAVLIVGGICGCLVMTGGIATLAVFSSTSTPTPAPATPVPTRVPPVPTAEVAPPASGPQENPPQLAGDGVQLNGTDLWLDTVQYSLINGGGDFAHYISSDEGFLFVVTLLSDNKDLEFVYDDYIDSMRLVDQSTSDAVEADFMNWSTADSATDTGFVRISFPLQAEMQEPALYFTDDIGMDLTSSLPPSGQINDPWWSPDEEFIESDTNITLQVVSATLSSRYTTMDGQELQKESPSNKLFTVRFTSPTSDLTPLQDWYTILLDSDNRDDAYYVVYTTWTNGRDAGPGELEMTFEVPPDLRTFILFIPFENLMDLTDIVVEK